MIRLRRLKLPTCSQLCSIECRATNLKQTSSTIIFLKQADEAYSGIFGVLPKDSRRMSGEDHTAYFSLHKKECLAFFECQFCDGILFAENAIHASLECHTRLALVRA